MKRIGANAFLRWVSLGLIFISVVLLGMQLIQFSRIRSNLPLNLTIADVPMGGLTSAEAAERLIRAYGIPIELAYSNAIIQVSPSAIGFSLNIETMLAAADLQRITRNFWPAFWDYLWNTTALPNPVPLSAETSDERIRAYLENEIIPRYNIAPKAPVPLSGAAEFTQGEAGRELEIDKSIQLIKEALRSPNHRSVILPFSKTSPTQANHASLKYLMEQILETSDYTGVAEFFIMDLDKREEIHFAWNDGAGIPADIAFTAASTIKIPIMIFTFAYRDEPLLPEMQKDLEKMIEISENTPADDLLQRIAGNLAPIAFTDDLQRLGYKNTFLGGLFYDGAPLIQQYNTPANSRTDINTRPDRYNQTTAAEIGMLLDDIYLCANYNGGPLKVIYGDQIKQSECQTMLDLMSKNKNGVLLEAGIPETTKVSHKHGWILESDGLIHNISDAGIIYSPKATYIFTMFFYSTTQLVFDPINVMASKISKAVYQFYN